MANIKLVKFKIKTGKEQVWRDWGRELEKRREEVLKTLKDEGVLSESCFVSKDGKFAYYFMVAKDFTKVKDVVSKSQHLIDEEHKGKRKESLEFVEELECIFNFENKK